jgi:prophage DNA circulation protein
VVAHHQTVNITATTYVDGLNVTFIATREALPDVQQVADYMVEALAELAADLVARDAGAHSSADDRKPKRIRTKAAAKSKASAKSKGKPTARRRRKAGA